MDAIAIRGVAPLKGHVGCGLVEIYGEIVGNLVARSSAKSTTPEDLSRSPFAEVRQGIAGQLARECNQVRLKEVSGAWRAYRTYRIRIDWPRIVYVTWYLNRGR